MELDARSNLNLIESRFDGTVIDKGQLGDDLPTGV